MTKEAKEALFSDWFYWLLTQTRSRKEREVLKNSRDSLLQSFLRVYF